MADVIITIKIMPESPNEDLNRIENEAKSEIMLFEGQVHEIKQVPVAFGLKSINIVFLLDESKGATDELEAKISEIKGVQSVEVINITRAFG